MSFPKKLLGQDERLVLLLRPHVKVLLWPVLTLLASVPAASFLAALVPASSVQQWLRWAIGAIELLVLLRWVLWPFLIWWNTTYAITDRRLVTRTGVLNRSGHDMPLVRLNDVSFSHTLLQRILGCGTLVVETAGERGQLVLSDVPTVEQVQRTLYRLSDDAREGDRGERRSRGDDGDELDGEDEYDGRDDDRAHDDRAQDGGRGGDRLDRRRTAVTERFDDLGGQ